LLIFLVVPILMGVFSVASIFSELGNGACFALVPHLPHNVRCSSNLDIGLASDIILTTICDFNHRVSCPALSVLLEISVVSFLS
jgi:nitrate/nitrite transporter NarK